MAAKKCVDCGATLTGWNSNFIGGRCIDCYRAPYVHAKAFFDRNPLTEQDIRNWKFSKSTKTLVGYALFLYACITIGSLVGFGKGGSYQGLIYAFVATLQGILFFRRLMNFSTVHPLTTNRWYNFAGPYSIVLFFSWAIAYMGWVPIIAGRFIAARSIFSHHVLITSTMSVPAFGLVLLVGIVAAIAGVVVGLWNASRQETKNKAHLLTQLQRWQQSK
ncbi:MAG: hypothetical protein KJ638_09270 [Chloroflexi bacterium]|nr:hypothetical protein [Chloroflexota bacterium]